MKVQNDSIVGPWQAFPGWSIICWQGKELTQEGYFIRVGSDLSRKH